MEWHTTYTNALSCFCIHSILIPYQHALFAHRSGSFFGNHVGYIIEPNTDVHFSAGSQYCIAPPCVRHCEALWTRLLLLLLIQMKQQQLQSAADSRRMVVSWAWMSSQIRTASSTHVSQQTYYLCTAYRAAKKHLPPSRLPHLNVLSRKY